MKVILNFVLSSLFAGKNSKLSNIMMGTKKNFVYGEDDALFGCIEKQQGNVPFGRFLDAGTGMHSLRWIATLGDKKGMTSFTAVTADINMQRDVMNEARNLGVLTEDNHIVVGNWFTSAEKVDNVDDTALDLPYDQYDTILADYLIGAMDGFSPYRQDEMIPKLIKLLKPGGNLYIIGLEPIPEKDTTSDAFNLICKVRRTRDACIQLAGHRCYREYPVQWIQKQILREKELLTIKDVKKFPILYRYNTIVRQIDVGRRKFPFFPQIGGNGESSSLVDAMKVVLDELDEEAKERTANGPIQYGFDYVVSVQKKK